MTNVVQALRSGRVRVLVALGCLAAVVVVGLDLPHAAADFTRSMSHLTPDRLPWICLAVVAECGAIGCFALVQRTLLSSGPHRLGLGPLFRLSLAALGLQAILPVGTVPSGGWLVAQYRRLRISTPFAIYVVVASFFAGMVSLLALLLLGALVSGIGTTLSVALGVSGLIALVVVAVEASHRFGDRPHAARRFLGRYALRFTAALQVLASAARCRIGVLRGLRVFGVSAGTWLFDCGCLACAFEFMGLAVPWRGLLLAYALAQVAGGAIPLPGGIGAVEGGAVGGLVLIGVNAGDALAATLLYRVISYWGEGLAGVVVALSLARRPTVSLRSCEDLELHPAGSGLEPVA